MRRRGIAAARRWLQRNLFWAAACTALATIVVLQAWPRRVALPASTWVLQRPAYADRMVEIPEGRMSLDRFARLLSGQSGVPIELVGGDGSDTPFNQAVLTRRGKLRLWETLSDYSHGVAWIVSYGKDGVAIGPEEAVHSMARCTTVIYPIDDLLTIDDPRVQDLDHGQRVRRIMTLIKDEVAPSLWRDAGGSCGSIDEIDGKIAVQGTPDMQFQVEQFLAALRESRR